MGGGTWKNVRSSKGKPYSVCEPCSVGAAKPCWKYNYELLRNNGKCDCGKVLLVPKALSSSYAGAGSGSGNRRGWEQTQPDKPAPSVFDKAQWALIQGLFGKITEAMALSPEQRASTDKALEQAFGASCAAEPDVAEEKKGASHNKQRHALVAKLRKAELAVDNSTVSINVCTKALRQKEAELEVARTVLVQNVAKHDENQKGLVAARGELADFFQREPADGPGGDDAASTLEGSAGALAANAAVDAAPEWQETWKLAQEVAAAVPIPQDDVDMDCTEEDSKRKMLEDELLQCTQDTANKREQLLRQVARSKRARRSVDADGSSLTEAAQQTASILIQAVGTAAPLP
jgi:ribosomal protein L28